MRKAVEKLYIYSKPKNPPGYFLSKLSNSQNNNNIKRQVHYHADTSNAMTTNHEHAVRNPLLTKFWSKKKDTFQHPSIGRITCDEPGCSGLICSGVCGAVMKKEYVGHATHSNYPGSKFLSYTDFQANKRPQYFVFYKSPIYNYDTEGKNINHQQTMIMNNDQGILIIIHVYSSTKPTIEEITYDTI